MNKKFIIFGNSGSGKSTLAKNLQANLHLAHLDLDTLAWQVTEPQSRKPLAESKEAIDRFMAENVTWVIEGCYTNLLAVAATQANHAIFLNLPVALCQQNARNRPWEPHKYNSQTEQNANLSMLLDWIAQYTTRSDELSFDKHQQLFKCFDGSKQMLETNLKNTSELKWL